LSISNFKWLLKTFLFEWRHIKHIRDLFSYSRTVGYISSHFFFNLLYLCMQEGFNLCKSPEAVLSFSEGEIISKVQVYNPVFDYVPPDLVTLFISNM